MKEQKIVVEIDEEGRITADADGFSGDACLRDLERLLNTLPVSQREVTRKPEAGKVRRSTVRQQRVEKKR